MDNRQRDSKAILASARVERKRQETRPASTIEELLSQDDEAFIICAYITLLGRFPEPEGLAFHLNRLRRIGRKSAILYDISKSQEGVRLRRTLRGLDVLIKRERWARIPVIGALFVNSGCESGSTALKASPVLEGPTGHTGATARSLNEVGINKPLFRFELDKPVTKRGVAVDPVADHLMLEGWVLARDGVERIVFSVDDVPVGFAFYGTARSDVGAVYPDWKDSARSGFVFSCPSRTLANGERAIKLTTYSKAGDTHVHNFLVNVKKENDPEAVCAIRRKIKPVERAYHDSILNQLGWKPRFEIIVVSTVRIEDGIWEITLNSILEQSWPYWRTRILAINAKEAEFVRSLIQRLGADRAGDFTVMDQQDVNWSSPYCFEIKPALFAFLYPGDELGRDALAILAIASGTDESANFFYADEFRNSPGSSQPEPFFKPDFSPTLLLSFNYVGRPLVLRSQLISEMGVTPQSLQAGGLYDLVLRSSEQANRISHTPELLSRTDKGVSNQDEASAAIVVRAMNRRGIPAEITPGRVPGTFHVRRTAPVSGKVAIIIPTCAAKKRIETCLETLRAVTTYKNYEIICAENIPTSDKKSRTFVERHADKVLRMPKEFNWSRFNNLAATAADGEYLLFLNDDVEIIEPKWIDYMLEEAARPEVGVVGARLLYPNRTVQHAGMFLATNNIGRHAFRHLDEADPGYFALAQSKREVIAVTGACLMVRKSLFRKMGGFDEHHDVVNNDLDFCLRVQEAGFSTIYTPHATLIHHELASREKLDDSFEAVRFSKRWGTRFTEGDPYFNVNLSRHFDDYRIDKEGVRITHGGHPQFDRTSIKTILAIKLDHIGDFITALPAMRRLKKSFPGARLVVLAAPASRAIIPAEPAIDEFIPFEFFHTRSELGERELTEDELHALAEKLAPYRFDIAVDFRKHLSTRHILRRSGASILAGFDWNDQFPWLDIALQWEGDRPLQYKRSHITDDLISLVATIETACEADRNLMHPRPVPMRPDELPISVHHLFVKPVVAIHPGSGNVMRQWPAAHLLALIDLLLERHDISVMLVGGKDDISVATWLIDNAARPERIASAAGIVPLQDLPRLLAATRLFIGNNSGPKHIAAGAGVPTIGIHSGVVDAAEWAPLGEQAVSVSRKMTCSPCYLAKPEDCPRDLACIRLLDPAQVYRNASKFLAR